MSNPDQRIVFLEFPDEAKHYLQQGQRETDHVVSLTPKTEAFLKRHGLSAKTSVSYFPQTSHEEVLKKSEAITHWLRGNFSFQDSQGVRKSYTLSLVWNVRLACHYFFWLLEILSQVSKQHRPDVLVVASHRRPRVGGHLIWPEERYLGVMAERWAKSHGILLEWLPGNEKAGIYARKNREDITRWSWKRTLSSVAASFYWQGARWRRGEKILFTLHPHQRRVLFPQFNGREKSFESLFLQGWRWPFVFPHWRTQKGLKREMDKLAQSIGREKELFSHHGITFADLIQKKLEKGIAPYLFRLARRVRFLVSLLESFKPACVFAAGNGDEDSFLGELCVKRQVPAMMVSHGSFVPPKSESEAIEWGEQSVRLIRAPYPYVALQSPLAAQFLREMPANGSPLQTGPLVWGGVVDRRESQRSKKEFLGDQRDKQVVLYANTPKGRGGNRFFVYETPDEFIQSLQELSRAVLEYPNLLLIIKFRPTYDMNLEDVQDLLPQSKQILIDQKHSFLEILGIADLFVSFSSTTIEEALQNQVPVLLYGGHGRYCHIPDAVEVHRGQEVKPAAVHWVRGCEDLSWALPKIFESFTNKSEKDIAKLFSSYSYPKEDRVPLDRWIRQIKGESHVPAR